MPRAKRKRSRSEDDDESDDNASEYAASEDDNDSEDALVIESSESDDDAEEEVGDDSKRKKKRRPAPFDKFFSRPLEVRRAEDPRLTARGGYNLSVEAKLKISRSNKGKQPWNKNQKRSATDKAKISAGVKARNRAILLEKLARLNMTEEEHIATQKKIKFARERLRKAKLATKQWESDRKNPKPEPAPEPEPEWELESEAESNSEQEAMEEKKDEDADDADDDDDDNYEEENASQKVTAAAGNALPPTVETTTDPKTKTAAGTFAFAPHPYDTPDTCIYELACPIGGPGGLICCAQCTAEYSKYLSSTYTSMEQQTTSLICQEAKDLQTFLRRSSEVLRQSTQTCKSIAPERPKKSSK